MARNNDQWIQIFQKQLLSGLSETAFCKKHNINPSTFSSRKSTMKQKNLFPMSSNPPEKQFIELSPITQISNQSLPDFNIAVGNLTIAFAEGMNMESFIQILQAIKENSPC
ncbi:MAG: hypothetical protein WCS73_12925 [Lentisphaeria bacterium]